MVQTFRKHYTSLTAVFLQSYREDLQILRERWEIGESDAALGRLHKIKGALLVLGEHALVRHCHHLAVALQSGKPARTARTLKSFELALHARATSYGNGV